MPPPRRRVPPRPGGMQRIAGCRRSSAGSKKDPQIMPPCRHHAKKVTCADIHNTDGSGVQPFSRCMGSSVPLSGGRAQTQPLLFQIRRDCGQCSYSCMTESAPRAQISSLRVASGFRTGLSRTTPLVAEATARADCSCRLNFPRTQHRRGPRHITE